MNNSSTSDLLEFDFYISANPESASAKEIEQILRDAGYSTYLPDGAKSEIDYAAAASRSKTLIILLTNDSDQTRHSLADLLNFLPAGAERRVIVIQAEECEIANLLSPLRPHRINLSGLDKHDRKHRILSLARNAGVASRNWTREFWDGSDAAFAEPPPAGPMQRVDSLRQVKEADPSMEEILASVRKLIEEDDQQFPIPTHASKLPEPPSKNLLRDIVANQKKPKAETDIVEFGVSHPTTVAIGVAFIVDLFMYGQHDRTLAIKRAAEVNPDNDRFRTSGAAEVARGTKLSVTLELPWASEPTIQTVYWNGAINQLPFPTGPVASGAGPSENSSAIISILRSAS